MNKNIIKFIIIICITFISCLLSIMAFPNLAFFKKYATVEITALAEKNDKSLGVEVWIDSINIDGIPISFTNLSYDENWIISNESLVFVGNNPNTFEIKYPTNSEISINFLKHDYSGEVVVHSDKNESVYDLFSSDYESVVFNEEKISDLSTFQILASAFIYFFIIIFLICLVNKMPKLIHIIPLIIYIYLCFCLRIASITQVFLFLSLFVSYFITFKQETQKYIISLFCILLYLLLVNFVVPINFELIETSERILYVFVNISFITILMYIMSFIKIYVQKLLLKDSFYIKWLKTSFLYFLIIFLFLILIWPGNWVWDEKGMFLYAQHYMYNGWQSYLMVLFYSWSLMLIPFVVGIPIIQSMIISLIFGYILCKIEEIHQSKKEKIILFILLLLPPVVLNILYPLRMSLYASLELLFLFKIYYIWKTNKEIITSDLLFFAFCIIFLSFWRSEGIYYIILGPLVLLKVFKNQLFSLKKCVQIFMVLLLFFLVYYPFKYIDGQHENIYFLTIFPNPLSVMLQDEDLKITDKDYNNLNRVFDLEILKKYSAYNEVPAFNYNLVRSDYKEYMSEFIISYIKVILNNPLEYLSARFKTFFATTGLDSKYANNSPWGFYDTKYTGNDKEILNMINNDPLSKPWNYELRNNIISFLKGADVNSDNLLWYGQIIWNFLPMLLVLTILLIYTLIKRKITLFLLIALCLIKVPIIFLTAPANYFFYYYSIYLIGLFPISYLLSRLLKIRKDKLNDK